MLPWRVLCILACEACERFCYYSVRSILVLLLQDLGYSKSLSVSLNSFWIAACYLTPLLGAALSDSRWGRFATILRFSLAYVVGMALLAAGGARRRAPAVFSGLSLVALGAGGIKPSVGPFGADQLAPPGGGELAPAASTAYFFAFYLCINVGSLAAYFFTPLLRAGLGFGGALALPAAAMVLSLALFLLPRRAYARVPPEGSALLAVAATVGAACRLRRRAAEAPPPSGGGAPTGTWLDAAAGAPGVGAGDVRNAAALWRMLPLLAMLPFFWAVFDAHSSVWLLQAEAMNLCFGGAPGAACIQPDQVPVLNPILVVCLIPAIERLLAAPALAALRPTPLRRMAVGLFLSTAAFAASGALQGAIERGAQPQVALQAPQYALLTVSEVFVSATGLEFFYAEAPPPVKGVVLALFFLTTAAGDLLNGLLYAALGFLSTSSLIWVVTGLNALAAVGFCGLAARFVPRGGVVAAGGGGGGGASAGAGCGDEERALLIPAAARKA